jgi:hypothetical protein
MPMVAHAAFDLTALAIIYWNLESAVAHFVLNRRSSGRLQSSRRELNHPRQSWL